MSFPKALFLIALSIHAALEGLVVIPFGFPLEAAFINIVGTAIHLTADSIISIIVLRAAQPLIRNLRLPGAAKVLNNALKNTTSKHFLGNNDKMTCVNK